MNEAVTQQDIEAAENDFLMSKYECYSDRINAVFEEIAILRKKIISLQETVESLEERSKPDGGSSDYYKLTITRTSDGETFDCEMGDIIYSVFGGDFNLGNIVKACRRSHLDSIGQGKPGAPIQYDMNKIKWFADDYASRTKDI